MQRKVNTNPMETILKILWILDLPKIVGFQQHLDSDSNSVTSLTVMISSSQTFAPWIHRVDHWQRHPDLLLKNDDRSQHSKFITQYNTIHSPAYQIADDICMADDDFIAVLRLVGIRTMDVSAESCLDSSTVLKNLQTAQVRHCHNNNTHYTIHNQY